MTTKLPLVIDTAGDVREITNTEQIPTVNLEVTSLADPTQTVISDPQPGDIAQYDGTQWVNIPLVPQILWILSLRP